MTYRRGDGLKNRLTKCGSENRRKTMKTMLLAAATVLALGAGSAYAGDGGSEGGTSVGQSWSVANGQRAIAASTDQVRQKNAGEYQIAAASQNRAPAFSTYQDNGQG
jgi:hypothetical protein